MKANRAYTHRFAKLATEFGCHTQINEHTEETPFLLTPLLHPETGEVATVVTIHFAHDSVWAIELSAALHCEVWRGLCTLADDEETKALANAVHSAHTIALAELRAGTLPGVDE